MSTLTVAALICAVFVVLALVIDRYDRKDDDA